MAKIWPFAGTLQSHKFRPQWYILLFSFTFLTLLHYRFFFPFFFPFVLLLFWHWYFIILSFSLFSHLLLSFRYWFLIFSLLFNTHHSLKHSSFHSLLLLHSFIHTTTSSSFSPFTFFPSSSFFSHIPTHSLTPFLPSSPVCFVNFLYLVCVRCVVSSELWTQGTLSQPHTTAHRTRPHQTRHTIPSQRYAISHTPHLTTPGRSIHHLIHCLIHHI